MQTLLGGELPWHRHNSAYAAIVLTGGYIERGDSGRWDVQAGDIVAHSAFEAHSNLIKATGATVVNINLPSAVRLPPVFRIAEPDRLISCAIAGAKDVATLLVPTSILSPVTADWPDLLAADLRRGPVLLGAWSASAGLAQETVSRGFFKVFGITPAKYRLSAQSYSALQRIIETKQTLADIAFDCGFADQPHLTRSIARLTGKTPAMWRTIKSVQDTVA